MLAYIQLVKIRSEIIRGTTKVREISKKKFWKEAGTWDHWDEKTGGLFTEGETWE